MVNRSTGETVPACCGANFCPWCGPRKASLIALAVHDAIPERWVRISLVGDSWQERRSRVRLIASDLRSWGYRVEWCWYCHRNPKGTGYHVHAHQHGDYVPQRELQRACERRGAGMPDIRAWRERSRMGSGYGMRELLGEGYAARATAGGGLDAYLAWNGARVAHTSRGFWRRGDGVPVHGLRDAVKTAVRARYGAQEGSWFIRREEA